MKPIRKHKYSYNYIRATYKRIMREEDKNGMEYSQEEFKNRLACLLYREDVAKSLGF